MEAPPNIAAKIGRDETFKKTTEKNENYSLKIKIKDNDSIYISISFEGDKKVYEDIIPCEEIKMQQAYFEDYSLNEIYDEISDLIYENNFELIKNNENILLKIILPSKNKKTLDFFWKIKYMII